MATEIFPAYHLKKNPGFQNLSFFQGGDPEKKSRFAKPEFFLGFETDLDFSNQRSGCRLKD